MYYVYLLKSVRDQTYYIGSTNDLKRRLEEHNSGKAKSTKSKVPFKLMYYEAYVSEADARHREHNLKLRSRALAQLKRRLEDTLRLN